MNWLIKLLGGYTKQDMNKHMSYYNNLLKKYNDYKDDSLVEIDILKKKYNKYKDDYERFHSRVYRAITLIKAIKEVTPANSIYMKTFDDIQNKLEGDTKKGRKKK